MEEFRVASRVGLRLDTQSVSSFRPHCSLLTATVEVTVPAKCQNRNAGMEVGEALTAVTLLNWGPESENVGGGLHQP